MQGSLSQEAPLSRCSVLHWEFCPTYPTLCRAPPAHSLVGPTLTSSRKPSRRPSKSSHFCPHDPVSEWLRPSQSDGSVRDLTQYRILE